MIWFLFVLNFAISWFNAWGCGRAWPESRAQGGWPHFMNWCGAIMSASGFTWCYLLVLGTVASNIPVGEAPHIHPFLPPHALQAFYALGYIVIILPILGSGIAITIQSWANYWRDRTFGSGAVATYNTVADVYNIVEAFETLPDAFSIIGGFFEGGDDDDDSGGAWLTGIVIMLVVVCIAGGVMTTMAILRSSASNAARERKTAL